jgi:ABC-type phosphate/phosphonate transport system permease subunit
MENGYDKVMGYVIVVVGAGVAFYFLYLFAVNILPWLILIAVVRRSSNCPR